MKPFNHLTKFRNLILDIRNLKTLSHFPTFSLSHLLSVLRFPLSPFPRFSHSHLPTFSPAHFHRRSHFPRFSHSHLPTFSPAHFHRRSHFPRVTVSPFPRFTALLLSLALALTLCVVDVSGVFAGENVDLYLFYGQGCGGCAKTRVLAAKLQKKYPQLKVKEFEIYFNQENRELFEKLCEAYQTTVTSQSVPVVFVDRSVFTGESKATAELLEQEVARCLREGAISPRALLMESKKVAKGSLKLTQENKKKRKKENKKISK